MRFLCNGVSTVVKVRRRSELLARLARGEIGGRDLVGLVSVLVPAAAIYGAVLGSWRGGLLILYAAIKVPLLIVLTLAMTMLVNWLVALALGLPVRALDVAVVSTLALTETALLVAASSPILWLFTISAPPPSLEARTTHNLLYLVHLSTLGAAGVIGSRVLWRRLRGFGGEASRARRVYLAWLIAFAFVGGELAWALRPFVGSIYLPVVFLRDDALVGNVYEFVFTDILPHLLS